MDREEQYIPDDPGALGETHLLHQRDFASFLLQPVQDTNDKPFCWTTPTIWPLQRKSASSVFMGRKVLTLLVTILKPHRSTKDCWKREFYLFTGVGNERVKFSNWYELFFFLPSMVSTRERPPLQHHKAAWRKYVSKRLTDIEIWVVVKAVCGKD